MKILPTGHKIWNSTFPVIIINLILFKNLGLDEKCPFKPNMRRAQKPFNPRTEKGFPLFPDCKEPSEQQINQNWSWVNYKFETNVTIIHANLFSIKNHLDHIMTN